MGPIVSIRSMGFKEDKMKEEIRNAPITLGFANVGYTRSITTIKGRDFEVPAYGGLYLTQLSSGIEKYYKIGSDVFTYKDSDDCIELIEFVRSNIDIANTIRNTGYSQCVNFCSWPSRGEFLKILISKLV